MRFPPVTEDFVPIPVVFAPSQQRGHEVAVYIFPHDHSLCYEFYFHSESADGVTKSYLCCGCKALRTRNGERFQQPVPSCKLRDGHFITDPMNPFRPHFCMPRSTPQATARRLVIERCNELRAGPCEKPTRNVVEDILSDITSPKFGGSRPGLSFIRFFHIFRLFSYEELINALLVLSFGKNRACLP